MAGIRRRLVPALVFTVAALVAGASPAAAGAPAAAPTTAQRLAPGVTLSTFSVPVAAGTATGQVLTVDLRNPRVRVGLLHPDVVGAREQVSRMATDAHAVAGVNADFFNISESQHPGVAATGSSNGPEVAHGRALKAAVPDSQRFGPAMAPGTSTRDVIGVGVDRRARVGTLTLAGSVHTRHGWYRLRGLNQYALPEGSIGAFTADWGTVSRQRAVCGSDTRRGDPCVADTAEVTVRHGRVVSVSDTVGAGAIPAGSTVLVGREAGADTLRTLAPGDPVSVNYRLAGARIPYRFAVGGAPILRDGTTMPGVDDRVSATRTGAGVSADGRTLYLVTLDGQTESGGGMTLAELSDLLIGLGADDGLNLDGGGSTTCAARLPGSHTVTVINDHHGSAERAVANGIGIF